MTAVVIIHKEFWQPKLGSQFGHFYVNQDIAEGCVKLIKTYFTVYTPVQPIGEVFSVVISDAFKSLQHHCKSY